RMDRLWDDLLSSWDTDPLRHDFQSGQFAGPRVDVFENDTEYRFEIELPGLDEQDIKMFVGNNVLTIKGQKKPGNQSPNERALRLERSYGAFERTFALPADVCEDKVEAIFINGVLVVRVLKNTSARLEVNRIEIKSAV
ncbi:MAG: Hsp20/alpha crystallin family protein, partial [Rhizobiales bacterium]|nr:Hsp20/alpha crystallin family protein [Hyphomicrobiales bacterium]